MALNFDTLREMANGIKNEIRVRMNTAVRIGSLFLEIIEKETALQESINTTKATLQESINDTKTTLQESINAAKFPEVPDDGKLYGRMSGRWVAIDTPPTPAPAYYNTELNAEIRRTNCGTGYTGSLVGYTVPAGRYSSTVSQADADAQAQADMNTLGLAYANAHGTCTLNNPPVDPPTTEAPEPTTEAPMPTN